MSSYIPPFRRGQADGVSPDPSSADLPPAVPSSYSRPYNNRGRGRGWRGSNRGFRGGRGNHGGRGGGGYQGQASTQDPPIDEADVYHQRDIVDHFFTGDEKSSGYHQSSTFHDSTAHPGQLSYVLLFHRANPRWGNDQIVFAKSKLNLLPEYAAKMLEHGPWDLQSGTAEDASIDKPLGQEVDGAVAGTATTSEVANSTVSDVNNKENENPNGQDGTLQSAQVTEESSPASVDKGKGQDSSLGDDAVEGDKTSTTATTPATSSSSRMKYTDVRLIPAEEFYDKEESHEPNFPSIQPVDYVPATHPHIAIFEERRLPGMYGEASNARFVFIGWHKVARVNLLAPHSAELVRMQQQKWERRDRHGRVIPTRARDAAAWNTAMKLEWAVVKFEKLGEEEAPPIPTIEKLPEPERRPSDGGELKGVNEMLAELRMKGDTGNEGNTLPGTDGEAGKDEALEKSGGAGTPEDKTQEPVAEQERESLPTT